MPRIQYACQSCLFSLRHHLRAQASLSLQGWIKEDAQADTIPPAYEAAGASALSILTDEKYFGGS